MKVMAINAQDTAMSKAVCANNDAESAINALEFAWFDKYWVIG